jgi:hypothetical protein
MAYRVAFQRLPYSGMKYAHCANSTRAALPMKAEIQRRIGLPLSVLAIGLFFFAARQARASQAKTDLVSSGRLANWMPATQEPSLDGTIAFLSDDRVVLSVCHIRGDVHCPLLVVLQVTDAGLRPLSTSEHSRSFGSVRTTEAGAVLVYPNPWLGLPTELLSADLTPKLLIPNNLKISLSGKTIGSNGPNNTWSISLVCPSLDCVEEIRNGTGQLQAVSDGQIAILDNSTVRIETIQGKQMGGFKVQSNCATELEFADKERIYFRSCGHDQIVDLNGRQMVRLRYPGQWGADFRRWSSDGTRLLYDQTVRTVPALQNIRETALAVATLGVGVIDEVPNGELVRVLDTITGKICFDWTDPKHLANMGVYPHAALSPSGKFVALVTEGELRVYRLPDVCSAK